MQVVSFIIILTVLFAATGIIILGLEPYVSVNLLWDWANLIGYVALGFILVLFIYTGQRRRFQNFSSKFYSSLHQQLGLVTLILVALHVGILLIQDSMLIEHLKITAPLYMLSGLIAFILIALLTFTSLPKPRRLIWSKYVLFKLVHIVTGIAIFGFTFGHIIGSQYYLNVPVKVNIFILISILIISYYFINKHHQFKLTQPSKQITVSGPVIISYLSALLLVCLAFLFAYLSQDPN